MQINNLKRNNPNKKRMIVARGGKRGKTAGRGGKGQSARAGNKRRPEWRDIIKRLPKLRGRGKNSNKAFQAENFPINISILEKVFSNNDLVTPTILIEKAVVSTRSGNIPMIKILGDGEVTKALNISGCFISESAKEKVIKAGGSYTPPISMVKDVSKSKPKAVVSETRVESHNSKAESKKESVKEIKVKAKKEVGDKKSSKKIEKTKK